MSQSPQRTPGHPADAGGDALDQLLMVEATAANLASQVQHLAARVRSLIGQQAPTPLLTVAQAARIYRLRQQAIRSAIADGRLPAIRRTGRGGRICHLLRVANVDALFGQDLITEMRK